MLGRSHGMSGVVAGLAAGAALDLPPTGRVALAGVTMIGSYVPDIDHRHSTITRAVPVLGAVASWLARGASRRVYAATRGPADEDKSGEHRHLTHTVVFAVVFGVLTGWGVYAAVTVAGWPHPAPAGLLVGGGLALGCVTHCVGDALTLSGCPFLWPLPIAGETWFELRPPRWLRFRTGGWFEGWVVFPALVVAAVLLTAAASLSRDGS